MKTSMHVPRVPALAFRRRTSSAKAGSATPRPLLRKNACAFCANQPRKGSLENSSAAAI
eukprot:CAMPEP_0116863828 /NCGR_PEP_ID=MMETSP0418-20121206/24461_1 /TAXON_ID=1158023 /ORGANISM="Astrosyne radiata, Strain 13vi08-1A" /LENGTH=58 /DNA_ID=CAMNT_0004498937 /DNA_START=272 /DNA_END=448 /DNA_ORIENTATION=+